MDVGGLALAVQWAGLLDGDPRYPLALAVGLGGGVFFFFRGFGTWRQLRLIQDTPTSKVRSLALGRAEVHGRAQEKAELRAPLTNQPCVYYRWTIEEEVRSNRHSRWRIVEQGDSEAWPFYLEDDTGRVLVDPRGARIDLPVDFRQVNPNLTGVIGSFLQERGIEARGFFGLRRKLRFSEWHVGPGEDLYVLGLAQERVGMAAERRRRITEKLVALKSAPEAMAHLDLDGDGHVSADEWDVARRLVVQQVEFDGFDDRVVIGRDEKNGATPFYISDRDEKAVVRKHRWGAVGGVFGGALVALGCLAGLLGKVGLL